MEEKIQNILTKKDCIKYESNRIGFLLMLGQATFAIPKFWRLKSFQLDSNFVTFTNCKGRIFHAPLNELTAEYSLDGHDRRFVTLVNGSDKFRYQEIIGQLEKEEWNHISLIINCKMSSYGRFQHTITGGAIKDWGFKKIKLLYTNYKNQNSK